MPTTKKKQKSKARKSTEAYLLSDIENMDIMRISNHVGREKSELINSVRRPESPTYKAFSNHDSTSHSNRYDTYPRKQVARSCDLQ